MNPDPLPAGVRAVYRYRLLGPLEVSRDGRPCAPSAPKQRALLALLLYHANEVVPTSVLIDELWGPRPPRSAAATLQMYVTALRRALVPYGIARRGDPRAHPILRTEPSGYVLRAAPDELDLTRFRLLAAGGRASRDRGDCAAAGDAFRRALALWRGSALADPGRTGVLEHYARRLEEERLALVQERVRADLCRGRGLEVVGELEELRARHPLHEEFHEQLMLALHQCGRRADALRVYARARRITVAELGIEPGPTLRAVQQAIVSGLEPPNAGHDAHRARAVSARLPAAARSAGAGSTPAGPRVRARRR